MSFLYGYALLIGIGSYAHTPNHWNIPITTTDVQTLANTLRDPAFCGYPDDQVTVLAGSDATRNRILGSLDTLIARVNPQATVFLFFSGHGHYGADGTYYLTTHDTQLTTNGKVAAGSGLSQNELIEKLRALQAARVLCLFNACHSGEISPRLAGEELFSGANPPEQLTAALLATGEGRVIITACRAHQYSFIGSGALTIFAQALVNGLRGEGISSSGGMISVFDLYTYLYAAIGAAVQHDVPANTRERYGQAQEPELTILKGVGPFPVALYHGATQFGVFDTLTSVVSGTTVRELSRDEAEAALLQITSGRDIVHAGHDAITGQQTGRDIVQISGGSYTSVHGDQYNLPGSYQGPVIIKSTVTQTFNATSREASARDELLRLVTVLKAEIQHVPAVQASDAEVVIELANDLVAKVMRDRPHRTLVHVSAEGLKQATQNIADVLPTAVQLADQITALIAKLFP